MFEFLKFICSCHESILKIIFFYRIVRKTIPSEFRFKNLNDIKLKNLYAY